MPPWATADVAEGGILIKDMLQQSLRISKASFIYCGLTFLFYKKYFLLRLRTLLRATANIVRPLAP